MTREVKPWKLSSKMELFINILTFQSRSMMGYDRQTL